MLYTLEMSCLKKGNDGISLLPPFGESEPMQGNPACICKAVASIYNK